VPKQQNKVKNPTQGMMGAPRALASAEIVLIQNDEHRRKVM